MRPSLVSGTTGLPSDTAAKDDADGAAADDEDLPENNDASTSGRTGGSSGAYRRHVSETY